MAETTRKRLGELTRGVFAVLIDLTEPLPVSQVLELAAERVPPTPFEQEMLPKYPKIRRFDNTIRFATVTTVKAGWLVKAKGEWLLTDEGRTAYYTFPEPEEFRREAERLYRAWKETQPETPEAEVEPEPEVPEDDAGNTFEEAEEAAWGEIRGYLATMPPYDFQNLVASLLKAMDYHVLWIAPPGPDRGIDMIAHTDPLGTSSPRIKVQVKRQADTKISREGISSFVGTLGSQDVGIYVSAGGFTAEAEREARSQEQRRVTLIDLDRLVELWIEHSAGLDDADRQRLPLKPIYFLAPRE
jgi:restriction system protein